MKTRTKLLSVAASVRAGLLPALYDWREAILRTASWNDELRQEELWQEHGKAEDRRFVPNEATLRRLQHLREMLAMARKNETYHARRVAQLLNVSFNEEHEENGIWQNLTRSTDVVRSTPRVY